MAHPSPRRFFEDHLPLLCWLVSAMTVTILTTVIDHMIGDSIIGIYFLAVPLLAIAWLAAAAAEFSRAMNGQYEGFRETMALLSGTLMLSIVGPFAILWLTIAADRALDWLGATARLLS